MIYSIKYMLYGRKKTYHMTKIDLCLPYDKHMGDLRPQCRQIDETIPSEFVSIEAST